MDGRWDDSWPFASNALRSLGLGFKVTVLICNRRLANHVKQCVFIFILLDSFIQFRGLTAVREVTRVSGPITVQLCLHRSPRVPFHRASLCLRRHPNYTGTIRIKLRLSWKQTLSWDPALQVAVSGQWYAWPALQPHIAVRFPWEPSESKCFRFGMRLQMVPWLWAQLTNLDRFSDEV